MTTENQSPAEGDEALAERLRDAYHSKTRIGHPLWQNLDADRKEPWLAVARAARPNVQPKGTPVAEVDDGEPNRVRWLHGVEGRPADGAKLYTQAPAPAPVPAEHLPTKEHIRELAQEALDQIMEQAQVFASAWSLVGGKFDFGNAMSDAEDAKAELRTMVRSLADLAAETVRPVPCAAVQAGKGRPTYAQIRMRAELLGRQHLRTDAEVHCLAERAGFKWIEADGNEDGFPGGFDMSDFKHMRRLVDSLTVDCQWCDGSGAEECGDPETGSVIENCGSCNGTGRAGFGESQPSAEDDREALFKALRETQEACDVSQCPWCGHWGQGYEESEKPADYCHHDQPLRPWRMFAKPPVQGSES